MIYIFDNGMSYSDHSITFVSTDGYDEKDAETLLRRTYQFGDEHYDPEDPDEGQERGFLVAKVEKIEWFAGKPQPLSEACYWGWLMADPSRHFDPLEIQTVEKLYADWVRDHDAHTEHLKEHYAKHPQPKRAAHLLADQTERRERDRKLLTETLDAYLRHRRGS